MCFANTLLYLFLFIISICAAGCGGESGTTAAEGISGTVSVPGGQTGRVYILAVEAAGEDAFYKIRNLETNRFPWESPHVAGYAALDGPGSYRLAGLPDGQYAIWAWMDVDGDSWVDHLDYLEPSGWYQTRDHLDPVGVSVSALQSASGIDFRLIAPRPYPENELSVVRGNGGGTLKTIRGHQVLQLRGTPEERAYANGYLVGPQIIDWINYVLLEFYVKSVDYYENSWLPFLREHGRGNEPFESEIEAMLEGIRDSGAGLWIDWLQRDITGDDIMSLNNLYMLGLWPLHERFGQVSIPTPLCTSVVFWGDRTMNPELEGALIHGKNMDGENDLRKITVNSLLIIAIEPSPESGGKRIVAIDWPGFYGINNGMNGDGLVLVPHSVVTIPDWQATDILDYMSLYRETLLTGGSINEAIAYWNLAPITRSGGFNTAVSMPYHTEMTDYPSVTFETDSYGGRVREPLYIDPLDPYCLITTNNFFKYTGDNPEAVEKTGAYHEEILPENYRYLAVMNLMDQYQAQGRTIGTPEVIDMLRAASDTPQYSGITEYSYIAYPNDLAFALAKEDLENKILDASQAEFTHFTFEEVF